MRNVFFRSLLVLMLVMASSGPGLCAENPSLDLLFVDNGAVFLSSDGENKPLPPKVFKLHAVEDSGLHFFAVSAEEGEPFDLAAGVYVFNKDGEAVAYEDLEIDEGLYAQITGGELSPNNMLGLWVPGIGKQWVKLGDAEAEVPSWWGEFRDDKGRSLVISNFRTGTYFSFTFQQRGKDLRDGTAVIESEDSRTAGEGALVFTLEPGDAIVRVAFDPAREGVEPGDKSFAGTYTRQEN